MDDQDLAGFRSAIWPANKLGIPTRTRIRERLNAHPGKGWPLIRVALANPTIGNRSIAIRALTAWPPHAVPEHTITAVRQAAAAEPDPKLRNRMRQLLTTWTSQHPPNPDNRYPEPEE